MTIAVDLGRKATEQTNKQTREVCLCLFFFQGCIPTIGRAMVVNAAQLASYSQAKEGLKSTGKFYQFE